MIHSIKEIDVEKEITETEIMYHKSKVIMTDYKYISEIYHNNEARMSKLKKFVCIFIAIYYRFFEIIYITCYFYFLPSMLMVCVILLGNYI